MIIAFPQQQWLYENSSMLRHTYTACLVTLYIHYMYHVHVNAIPRPTRGTGTTITAHMAKRCCAKFLRDK